MLDEDANVFASTRRWRLDDDAVTVVGVATSPGACPYHVSRSSVVYFAFQRLSDGTEKVVVLVKLQSRGCRWRDWSRLGLLQWLGRVPPRGWELMWRSLGLLSSWLAFHVLLSPEKHVERTRGKRNKKPTKKVKV